MAKNKQAQSVWLQKQSIPNWLTLFRILLVPLVIIFLLISDSTKVATNLVKPLYQVWIDNQITISVNASVLIAGIFFILASVTDFLDGFLARKYHWVSDFGKLWDPLADKLLTNSVLICLGALGYLPIWLVLIFVIRDIIIDGYRMLAAKAKVVVAANWIGKIKTVFMMVGIIYIFFLGTRFHGWYYWTINNLCLYIGAILAIVSGIIYMIQISKQLHRQNHPSESETHDQANPS